MPSRDREGVVEQPTIGLDVGADWGCIAIDECESQSCGSAIDVETSALHTEEYHMSFHWEEQ